MTTTSIDTAGGVKEAFGPFGHHRDAEGAAAVKRSGSAIVNALWEADRNGDRHPLRTAIRAAREYGMTLEQIAEELMTTVDDVVARATEVERPGPYW
jgi:hypothetical protein